MPTDLDITLDFASVQQAAERVRDMLADLRQKHDLARFEYAKKVRIAPTEIPHSHPTITLNTWIRDDLTLLSTYLHEQMHWYVTWYSHAFAPQWQELFRQLRARYPAVPVGGADGAQDEFSTYLHLIVNWLEIEAVSHSSSGTVSSRMPARCRSTDGPTGSSSTIGHRSARPTPSKA